MLGCDLTFFHKSRALSQFNLLMNAHDAVSMSRLLEIRGIFKAKLPPKLGLTIHWNSVAALNSHFVL